MLETALHRIIAKLEELEVRYALVGGFALIARGVVRATEDIDFMVDLPPQEAPSLARSLSESGMPSDFRESGLDDPLGGLIRVNCPTEMDPVRCDIILPSRAWHTQAVRNAGTVKLEGIAVSVVQALDLFLLKLSAGGPQDLLDAANLFELQSEDDRKAWKERARQIGRSKNFDRCMKFLKDHG